MIIQHLSPDYASSMAAILQRATQLKVVALEDNTTPLPDHVYVKPPSFDIRLTGQVLRLVPRAANDLGLYLPIDEFFFSLAEAREQDAIGIVLSGMGTDGSRGAREIKARGGLVMVQEPETTEFDGMPRATIRQRVADVVLPTGELATRLGTMLRDGVVVNAGLEDLGTLNRSELIDYLLDRIRMISRIDFTRYRQGTILRRIEKRLLITQRADLEDYISFALNNEDELLILRNSFLIGVTRFFRDREAFDFVREHVIPKLFEEVTDREIRLWVPSCSTGEEAYSLAMLMEEHRRNSGAKQDYKVFGSDVDRKSILLASRGEFDDSILGDIPGEYLSRYFLKSATGFRVKSELKERMLFAVQNLLDDPPFIRIDLCSCRNFMIYISNSAQQRVLGNFHFSLHPGGYLFLGPSESLGSLQSAFFTVERRWKIYKKRTGVEARIPRTRPIPVDAVPAIPEFVSSKFEVPVTLTEQELRTPSPTSTTPKMDYFSQYLAERYAPATIFVNSRYEILYLNGDFGEVLHIPRFNAKMSLRTMLHEDLQALLLAGVDQVITTGKGGIYDRMPYGEATEDQAAEAVKIRLSYHEFDQLGHPVAVLEFFPPTSPMEPDPEVPEGEGRISIDQSLRDRVKSLELELARSEQQGQKLLNQLEATNEELQSSNRELLASNEEMQSTNEELQSVNEELYTVNNEFQRKNDELNDINTDVSNLLKSTQISTIFIDESLRIRRFTPGVGQQFDLHASDVGRPITSFSNPFEHLQLEELCRQVIETGNRHDQEVVDKQGGNYLVRMLPYLTDDEQRRGIVITFVDISDQVRTRRRYTDLAHKYEAMFHNTQEVIAIVRQNSRIDEINHPIHGTSVTDMVGSYFTDLIATDQEKVRFNELLRQTFDRNEVTTMMASLRDTEEVKQRYTTIEIIPIVPPTAAQDDKDGEVNQSMIIIHDITNTEQERREMNGLLESYELQLARLRQMAGLIALDGRMMVVNKEVTGSALQLDTYKSHLVTDYLTEKGQVKFAEALEKIKTGSRLERIDYLIEDLVDDDYERTVFYRPVKYMGELALINFEVQA